MERIAKQVLNVRGRKGCAAALVMFKVTICDFGKMNINMTDKIEKKESSELCISHRCIH